MINVNLSVLYINYPKQMLSILCGLLTLLLTTDFEQFQLECNDVVLFSSIREKMAKASKKKIVSVLETDLISMIL